MVPPFPGAGAVSVASRVGNALANEAARLSEVMSTLPEPAFDWSTGCPPWNVQELFAHVHMGVARISTALTQPTGPGPLIDAARYYRRDHRFSPETDAERIASAQCAAASWAGGRALAAAFDRDWRHALQLVAAEAPGRTVSTRHGDLMPLHEFLITRVVELAVHGLDLALALRRPPWLTDDAAAVVTELLTGGVRAGPAGWDQLTLVRKATGREPASEAEIEQLRRAGVRWLAFQP